MTTELVELAERPEFTVDEALRIADQNADSYEKVASVSRTLAAEVRRLRALASRAGGWRTIDSAPTSIDPMLGDVKDCLLYGPEVGRKMGRRAKKYAYLISGAKRA